MTLWTFWAQPPVDEGQVSSGIYCPLRIRFPWIPPSRTQSQPGVIVPQPTPASAWLREGVATSPTRWGPGLVPPTWKEDRAFKQEVNPSFPKVGSPSIYISPFSKHPRKSSSVQHTYEHTAHSTCLKQTAGSVTTQGSHTRTCILASLHVDSLSLQLKQLKFRESVYTHHTGSL